MKKLLFVLFVASIVFIDLSAQEVLLEKNVEDQYKEIKGPNMRHYGHFYFGLGDFLDFDENAGTEINPWKSVQFMIGYRYKLKLCSFYALGLDLSFKTNSYFLEGDDVNPVDIDNPLAVTANEKKHLYSNNGLGMEIYQRINIGKRGNALGKYFDIGARGQWNISDIDDIITVNDDDPYTKRVRVINRRLKYVEPFSYGLSARIGINKMIIYGDYRLSDIFKSEFNMGELPRLSLGLQLVLD